MFPDSLNFFPTSVDAFLGRPFVGPVMKIIVVLVVLIILVRLASRLAQRFVTSPEHLYHTTKQIRRLGMLAGLLLIAGLVFPSGNLVAVLTVIGAGLAIALREVLLSCVGWSRIRLMNSYVQGDRIEINGVRGDVVDIRVLRTTLMEIGGWVGADQSTGRIVHVPNSWIFEHALYNYTRGFRFVWNEFPVTLTFRSDWEAAREIMRTTAEESAAIVEKQAIEEIRAMSREFLIHYSILMPYVYVDIVGNGVQLTLRYLCEVRKRRGSEHALSIQLLQAFQEHGGIELAYPMIGVTQIDARPPRPSGAASPPTRPNA